MLRFYKSIIHNNRKRTKSRWPKKQKPSPRKHPHRLMTLSMEILAKNIQDHSRNMLLLSRIMWELGTSSSAASSMNVRNY